MPQPPTGWISEIGASERAKSVAAAPPTSASSPIRQCLLNAYVSSTLRSSVRCGSCDIACFWRTLPMLLAAEPTTAMHTAMPTFGIEQGRWVSGWAGPVLKIEEVQNEGRSKEGRPHTTLSIARARYALPNRCLATHASIARGRGCG